ncbi:alpha-1,6-glucosidase domain-containing protein [Kitasatospora sp. NPDC008115]|uniref:alpha-1,6-glucosidase domain-containing protein n=1 Tax=Kitasatospora sp. NPDC008115 TaxID=3364022 RepID=UPI0036EE1131
MPADPRLTVGAADIRAASAQYQDLPRIKRSSPLFALPTLEAVQQWLSYPLSGTPGEPPGVITLHLDGTGLPGAEKGVTVASLAGTAQALHPVQAKAPIRW